GRVFIGAQGDLGWLVPDSSHMLRYVSLLPFVSAEHLPLGDIWDVHVIGSDVYFQGEQRLLRWDGQRMHVWETSQRFHKSFEVEGRLFVRERFTGLQEVVGDDLRLLPNGELFGR